MRVFVGILIGLFFSFCLFFAFKDKPSNFYSFKIIDVIKIVLGGYISLLLSYLSYSFSKKVSQTTKKQDLLINFVCRIGDDYDVFRSKVDLFMKKPSSSSLKNTDITLMFKGLYSKVHLLETLIPCQNQDAVSLKTTLTSIDELVTGHDKWGESIYSLQYTDKEQSKVYRLHELFEQHLEKIKFHIIEAVH